MAASKRVGIADLKTNLSRHLRDVKAGETITVVEHDKPVATLVAYAQGNSGGLEVREPISDPKNLATTTSPLKKLRSRLSSLEILTELRGDK